MGDNNSTFNSGPGGSQYYYEQSAKFNPTTAVVIISLIGGCFVLAFVSVVLRKWIRGDSGTPAIQPSVTQQSGSYNEKAKGLAKADVDALPLVHRADLDEKLMDARECPVCLTDFELEDPLRLLPTCKHVFHQECIDAWFDAHSTCPLCRASLLGGETETMKPHPISGHGDPVETIAEVSESGHSSDTETRPPPNTLDAPLDTDSRMVAREESVFQTSESFKRQELQPSSTKNFNSSFPKPSIRRSSSLSADLVALRNLLMRQNDQNVNSDAPSRRWFTRARSLDLTRPRDRSEDSRDREEWVTIDLETGKAAQLPSSSNSKGESSKTPERSWSDRWSLATLKSAVLTRSTSDVFSRSAHLPI